MRCRAGRQEWQARAVTGRGELVADAAHRDQALAVAGAELPPQAVHVHVDRACALRGLAPPDPPEQLPPGEDSPGVGDQEVQQLELPEGQLDPGGADPDFAALAVDDQAGRGGPNDGGLSRYGVVRR
jgi:hypothetical protein